MKGFWGGEVGKWGNANWTVVRYCWQEHSVDYFVVESTKSDEYAVKRSTSRLVSE